MAGSWLTAKLPLHHIETFTNDGHTTAWLSGGQLQLQVVVHGLRVGKHFALLQALGHGPAGEFEHRHNLGALGWAQNFDPLEVVRRGVQQSGYASKPALVPVSIAQGAIIFELQQLLGHLQHPFACNAGAQKHGQ
jgi:hypothetical protein